MKVAFHLNEQAVALELLPDRRLIDILREDFGLMGPKNGCGIGRCGACLVLVDDQPVNACLVLAAKLCGRKVVTIEGLGTAAEPVRDALAHAGAVQCGYCASGIVTALTWLAMGRPGITVPQAELMLTGQICRCTGYGGLRRALRKLFHAEH
jgi:carbon-monoxide dehydrogenase small subunit